MINLSTPNKELIDELYSDMDKAIYWMKKKMGGERKFVEMTYLLQRKAKKSNSLESSSTYEYISPKGNRWISSLSVGDINGKLLNMYQVNGFCYYETFGSIGAFMPLHMVNYGGKRCCVIFTSHFFYQFCERAKIPYRSKRMVMAFSKVLPTMVFDVSNDRGRQEIQCRLPNGIGFGVPRDESFSVIEVRTYLSDSELNGRQKRITEDLRRISDDNENRFISKSIVAGGQTLDDAYSKIINEEIEVLKDIGVKEKSAKSYAYLLTSVWYLFVTNGYAHQIDFSKFREHLQYNFGYIEQLMKEPYTSDDDFYRRVISECAKNLKIKNVDIDKLMRHLNKAVEKLKSEKYESKN